MVVVTNQKEDQTEIYCQVCGMFVGAAETSNIWQPHKEKRAYPDGYPEGLRSLGFLMEPVAEEVSSLEGMWST